ncbi:hypothetical protein ABZS86_18695 [Streptomyces sp. NPDC005355]|uniref:hypothetical protein n=1 Tax=Streptomyces sp. NPDC005355 TaxID=3157038 RepID=UPI0033AA7299
MRYLQEPNTSLGQALGWGPSGVSSSLVILLVALFDAIESSLFYPVLAHDTPSPRQR